MIYFSQDAYRAKKKCFVEPFIHKSIHAHKNKFGLCLSSVSITVYLFSPKSLQGEMPFFFLPQSLQNPSSFTGAFIHTHTTQCGLGASLHDRHPRSHSIGFGTPAPVREGSEVPEGTEPQSVCLPPPYPPLSHSLARTCPSPPPPKPLFLHLSPLLSPLSAASPMAG